MFLPSNVPFAAAGGFTVIAFSSLMLCRSPPPPASPPTFPLWPATPLVCFVLQGPLFYDSLFMILILASFLQAPSFPSLLQCSEVTSLITAGRKDTCRRRYKEAEHCMCCNIQSLQHPSDVVRITIDINSSFT